MGKMSWKMGAQNATPFPSGSLKDTELSPARESVLPDSVTSVDNVTEKIKEK